MPNYSPAVAQETLLLNKCIVLIHDTRRRLRELNPRSFPAQSTQEALDILRKTVDALGNKENLRQARPAKVYPALLALQDLIQDIELSASYHLSWPLIELLGGAFSKLVAEGDIAAFYATMREHNYRTFSYNELYRRLLRGALPEKVIASILGRRQLLCVQLPPVEEEHPALHTNVLHEFGHVLLVSDLPFVQDFVKVWLRYFRPFLREAESDIVGNQEEKQEVRTALVQACFGFTSETVCDSFGASVVGPAFSISCNEMQWNRDPSFWVVQPTSSGRGLQAHPSFAFRNDTLKALPSYSRFRRDALHLFTKLQTPGLRDFDLLMGQIDTPGDSDRVVVNRSLTANTPLVERILNSRLSKLKTICRNVTVAFEPKVASRLRGILDPVSPIVVFELLRRLEDDLTPNTSRDEIPCGPGADFQSILAAGLYYRLALLSERSADEEKMVRKLGIADRLVAKAIEQSYVQHHANPQSTV